MVFCRTPSKFLATLVQVAEARKVCMHGDTCLGAIALRRSRSANADVILAFL